MDRKVGFWMIESDAEVVPHIVLQKIHALPNTHKRSHLTIKGLNALGLNAKMEEV